MHLQSSRVSPHRHQKKKNKPKTQKCPVAKHLLSAPVPASYASCQATLKVERSTHVKKEYVSDRDKKKQAEKELMDKKVRLSMILMQICLNII